MSRRRTSSVHQNERTIGHLRGPHGYRLCRFCKKEVQPPRKTFCSDECIHQWKLRSNVSYLREHVYKRDRGICAKCGVDTRMQKIRIEDVLCMAGHDTKNPTFLALIKEWNLTVHESQKSLWQADHIVAVSEGGGETGLDNIRTLCTKCHKEQTAGQARRRLAPTRPIKQMASVKGVDGVESIKPLKGLKGL